MYGSAFFGGRFEYKQSSTILTGCSIGGGLTSFDWEHKNIILVDSNFPKELKEQTEVH